ncbi:MBL fold metallo-hydrolase [Paenibacillus sp. ACRRX]|uniref:MBL fold metallo-hydrolase n=1 Tax=Paenibacillus sp. ACRRX TaxID=2918206 RepID=UPI001EF400BF|nr:MBL fold metallo-hydrolase [Paenibacillus sp. ACRRX]MCG7409698.1 MBL fold metallo-hydrolase [Paenibacillus sp. ACRRX]
MRMSKVHQVFQLSFMPNLFPVNCYLIEEERELTLIDAALPYSDKSILQAAERIGKPITRIVLTHAHDDHVGALDKLKVRLPEAKVYISARDAKLLHGDTSLETQEPTVPIRGSVPKKVKTIPDCHIQDGDPIGSLMAISTPGHTPGSMSFLDTRSKTLIAGDAFQTRGGIAVSGTMKPWFPFPAMATWHKESALSSAKRLIALQPATLAVGHGLMLANPLPAMQQSITEAEAAIERSAHHAARS